MQTAYRRIAQGQSTSIHTEGAAAFDSCSAYQTSSDILFLSHCVPDPPDKGERIRAHWLLNALSERFRVHLVCFAKSEAEARNARTLASRCASVHVEELRPMPALARAAVRFGFGASISTTYYESARVRHHISKLLASTPLRGVFCYSSAVAPFAPPGLPLLLDFVDMDSEKWLQYGRTRRPGFAYHIEGRRLRRLEKIFATQAARSFVTTGQERALLESIAPDVRSEIVENGVDFDYFDPAGVAIPDELAGRRILLFTGVMSYYPNAQGVCRFAESIFPKLRRVCPGLELFVVGSSPSKAVLALASRPGITVTGAVKDVRPYLAAAHRVIAPLDIARGIQNKVLEGLAMGKQCLCSPAIFRTFGENAPLGAVLCDTEAGYIDALRRAPLAPPVEIRRAARERFSWSPNLRPVVEAMQSAVGQARP